MLGYQAYGNIVLKIVKHSSNNVGCNSVSEFLYVPISFKFPVAFCQHVFARHVFNDIDD